MTNSNGETHRAFVENLLEGAIRKGLSRKTLLKGIEIKDTDKTIKLDAFIKLTRRVAKALDDEVVGLLEKRQRIGVFSIVASYASHAKNIQEVFCRISEAFDLADNSLKVYFSNDGNISSMIVERRPDMIVMNALPIESLLVLTHRFISWLSGRWLPITSVALDYTKPYYAKSYEDLFPNTTITFNNKNNHLSINNCELERAVLRNQQQVKNWAMRAPLDAYLPIKVVSAFGEIISNEIEKRLIEKNISISMESVASSIGVPIHTIRRRLESEGTTYLKLRNQVRRDVAVHLMSLGHLTFEEIACQLQFSEVSAFSRAFKSWTGFTPKSYKNNCFD